MGKLERVGFVVGAPYQVQRQADGPLYIADEADAETDLRRDQLAWMRKDRDYYKSSYRKALADGLGLRARAEAADAAEDLLDTLLNAMPALEDSKAWKRWVATRRPAPEEG